MIKLSKHINELVGRHKAQLEPQAETMVSGDYCVYHSLELQALSNFLFPIRAKADDLCQGLVNHSLTPTIKPIDYFWLCHS